MNKNEIILVLGVMVGYFIVFFSSNSTTILQVFGSIIGMAIVAGITAYYAGKRTIEHYPLYSGWELVENTANEDLEEEAKNYLHNNILYDDVYVGKLTDEDCIEMFKAGAKWQQEKMMENTIDGTARPDDNEIWCNLVSSNLKDGDKVKVIIIKGE